MENPGKETYVEQMERVNQTNPFMLHNRIRAVALSEDRAEVRAEITEDSLNAMQTVHGGLMFVMAEVAAGLVTRNDGRKYVTLDSSFRFLRGSSAKTFRGWRRSQSAGRPSALQKLRSWRPIRGSSWQKENLRFIVWVSRDKNKNPAITRVFETYLGEPCGEKSHNQQFISDPLF